MNKKRLFKITGGAVLIAAVGLGLFLQHPQFGKSPRGARKERILKSPNYKDGKFESIEYTPDLSEDTTFLGALMEMFKGDEFQTPKTEIPRVETDLKKLSKEQDNFYVWLGHSSYLLQIDGIKYLMDPVLSGSASPILGSGKAFKGSDYFKVDMLPENIDYLIISHDHYDHLDYETVKELKNKVKKVIVPLGVGEHFEYWGYNKEDIIELDWYDNSNLQENIKITSLPARHKSGRLFGQPQTLWSAYSLEANGRKIYLGGDSSYGKHFKEIGEKYGPFDLAIIENGQYNKAWKYSHLFPEETLIVTRELGAKHLIPVHNSKFTLAPHNWNEPLKELVRINDEKYNVALSTPKIGEVIELNNLDKPIERWFEDIN